MDTVIQRLARPEADGNQIYLKRDDLLPFSIGGNKVRIAQVFYEDMLACGGNAMVIYGSRHSNLCRVLSDLCCSRGTPCYMICSHEPGESEEATNNTHLIDWTGTEIVHCAKNRIAPAVQGLMERLRAEGKKPYYIYGNQYGRGNEGVAAGAYARAYNEILAFQREQGWDFDYLFCPSGTGATQTGLIAGHLLSGDRTRIIGIMISSRETQRARQVIAEGLQDYFRRAGRTLPSSWEEEIHLLDQYRQGGYGKYDGRVETVIREQYRRNGIALDPIYTAKGFWGMEEYLRTAGIRNCRILYLHTGGTPLFFDYLAGKGMKS